MKPWILVAVTAMAPSLSGFAAHAASALAQACAADIQQFCGGVKQGGGSVKDCVKARFSDLSADCQVAIVRAAAVGRACKADVEQFCPGKAALADCMKSHAADLGADCKEAMAKADSGTFVSAPQAVGPHPSRGTIGRPFTKSSPPIAHEKSALLPASPSSVGEPKAVSFGTGFFVTRTDQF